MVCKWCFYIGSFVLFCMALFIGYEVAFRYFFTRPTSWVLDFSEYILIYSTFLAAPWLYKIGGHTSVTIVVDVAGPKSQVLLEGFSWLVSSFICAVLIYLGFTDTWEVFQRNVLIIRPIIVPKWMILWVIPFGLILLFIYVIRGFAGLFRSSDMKNQASAE